MAWPISQLNMAYTLQIATQKCRQEFRYVEGSWNKMAELLQFSAVGVSSNRSKAFRVLLIQDGWYRLRECYGMRLIYTYRISNAELDTKIYSKQNYLNYVVSEE